MQVATELKFEERDLVRSTVTLTFCIIVSLLHRCNLCFQSSFVISECFTEHLRQTVLLYTPVQFINYTCAHLQE